MIIPQNSKIEKVVSVDKSRPSIGVANLEVYELDGDRYGRLTATDGRMMVQLRNLRLDEHDVAGPVTVDAIKAAKKSHEIVCNGSLAVKGGPVFSRPEGVKYPDVDQVIDPVEGRSAKFRISINAELLLAIQQGLGSDGVELVFGTDKEPVLVKPLKGTAKGSSAMDYDCSGSIGILMPMFIR